jgi:signal transduction histidine kinase/signal recognition particle receptor subunit beta
MSQIDTEKNLLQARIVYWGPAACGKTSTLVALRPLIDPEHASRVYSVAAADGSTLAFDLLPVEEFKLEPYRARIRVVAVPGATARAGARLALLKEADAVVFVADSAPGSREANRASWQELQGTLKSRGVSLPTVIAVHKRDLPDALPVSEVRNGFGPTDAPTFETAAGDGLGILETFSEVFRLLVEALVLRHSLAVGPGEPRAARLLPQLARGALARPARESRHLVIRPAGPDILGPEQALAVQLGLVQAHVEADAQVRLLHERNREVMAANRIARSILSAMEVDNLLVVLVDSASEYLGVTHATCVLFDPKARDALRSHVSGFGRDPVLGLKEEAARRFFELLRNSDGPVPFHEEHNPELLEALKLVDTRIKRAIFQPIKGDHDRPTGWIGIYHMGGEPRLSTQGLLFLSSVSRVAALGLEKIALVDRLQRGQAQLEATLRQRTGELEMANARIRALNRGLESRVKERTRALEDSNRQLREAQANALHAARVRGMGQVASSFAHEINNPVAALAGNLQFMRENLDEVRARIAAAAPGAADALRALDEFEAIIHESQEGAQRVSGIITTLKRIGGEENPQHTVALNALVADAVMLLEERLRAAAEVELRLGAVPEIEGDGVELGQVVLALLTNAVEALERHAVRGHVVVTTFAAGERVTLMIKDDGAGIEAGLLEHVFEPFTTTKSEPAAGLGLHFAYQAIRRAGGSIRLKSKPGEGTTATVALPVKARADVPAAEETRAP